MKLSERFQAAWNAFRDDRRPEEFQNDGNMWSSMVSSYSPNRRPSRPGGNRRTIINGVLNRIAVDAAAIEVHHVQLDENGRFKSYRDSRLEECLSLDANLDQTGRALRQDIYQSCMDEGVICVVPVDTTRNPHETDGYEVCSLRVGRITAWYPQHVRVDLYDERDGRHKEILWPKSDCAIIENPFFMVMNDANSLLRRIIKKLDTLDLVDNQVGSDKLDLLIQLPYAVRTPAQEARADMRRKSIETQLAGSKYGIAYIDASEKVTQLNRSVENNLLSQVEFLTGMLYSQLGVTQEILNGTADEATMLNYYNRTIGAYCNAFCDEFKRKFLSSTAIAQGQSVEFYRDPFELVPVGSIADIADKFTRNEILSPNELRGIIGFKPVDDERADELRNRNLNQSKEAESGEIEMVSTRQQGEDVVEHSAIGKGYGQICKRR